MTEFLKKYEDKLCPWCGHNLTSHYSPFNDSGLGYCNDKFHSICFCTFVFDSCYVRLKGKHVPVRQLI